MIRNRLLNRKKVLSKSLGEYADLITISIVEIETSNKQFARDLHRAATFAAGDEFTVDEFSQIISDIIEELKPFDAYYNYFGDFRSADRAVELKRSDAKGFTEEAFIYFNIVIPKLPSKKEVLNYIEERVPFTEKE